MLIKWYAETLLNYCSRLTALLMILNESKGIIVILVHVMAIVFCLCYSTGGNLRNINRSPFADLSTAQTALSLPTQRQTDRQTASHLGAHEGIDYKQHTTLKMYDPVGFVRPWIHMSGRHCLHFHLNSAS